MFIEKVKISVIPEIMRIDTWTQAIDIQQIDNRRFMYNPDTGLLVLVLDGILNGVATAQSPQIKISL